VGTNTFLAKPRGWGQRSPPKRWYRYTSIHGVTSQETGIFVGTCVILFGFVKAVIGGKFAVGAQFLHKNEFPTPDLSPKGPVFSPRIVYVVFVWNEVAVRQGFLNKFRFFKRVFHSSTTTTFNNLSNRECRQINTSLATLFIHLSKSTYSVAA
jgi:hypothetical protein